MAMTMSFDEEMEVGSVRAVTKEIPGLYVIRGSVSGLNGHVGSGEKTTS